MTSLALNGGSTPAVSTSFTDKWVETSSGVSLPTGARLAANGNRPVYVAAVRVYWAGRSASRKLRVLVGGFSTPTVTVASAGSAGLSSVLSLGALFPNGGVKTVRIDANPDGQFYFGRASGTGSVDSYGTSYGQLSGSVEYYEVPTAPTSVTAVQAALENAVNVSWTAPSNNGGSAITSYQIEWSYNADFSGSTIIGTGSTATSYKVTGLAYGSTVYVKVAAINVVATAAGTTSVYSSSATGYVIPPNLPLNGWANFGSHGHSTFEISHTSIPALIPETGIQRKATSTSATGNYAIGNFGIEKVYTNLIIGRQYIMSGKAILLTSGVPGNIYRFAVNGIGNGSSVTLSSTTVGSTIPSYTFTATSTTHTLQVELAESVNAIVGVMEHVAVYDYALTKVATDLPYRLQDNQISGTLVDHFDLATQSVGAYWWVDKNNVTQFTQDFDYSYPLGTFSDVIADGNLYYTDIKTSFDTSAVINDITFNNEGSRTAATGSDKINSYTVTWNQSEPTSIAAWGARNYDLRTNIYTSISTQNILLNPHFAYGPEYLTGVPSSVRVNRVEIATNATGATNFLPVGTTAPVAGGGGYCARMNMLTNTAQPAIVWLGDGIANAAAAIETTIKVSPSTAYNASIYMRAGVGNTASLTGRVTVYWYTEAGVLISQSNGTTAAMTSTTWTRREVQATSPTNAAYALVVALFIYTGANNSNFGYYAACGQLEPGTSSTAWFSGDSADTTSFLYEWEGAAGASHSIRYNNVIDDRTTELLAGFATPEITVDSLTFNTAQNPPLSSNIDIGSLITVEFQGNTDLYRVAGISHDINPERWMMTLQTAKVI
jgi:hypothetical protein